MTESLTHPNPKRFRVALSFAGEHRDFVGRVAKELSRKLGECRIFYDQYHQAELARPNLDIYLTSIYQKNTDLIAIFLCSNYAQKEWCGLERRVVREFIKGRLDSEIILFKFDDVIIEGLLSIDGYIDIGSRTPKDVADLILQRIDPAARPTAADAMIKAKKPLVPDQKSRRVSIVTIVIVGLMIAAVGALVAVPGVREWLGLSKPREITTRIGMTLVRIPAGEFQMGSNSEERPVQRPVHHVRISEPFYLGKYEVTQAQWQAVMGTNPSSFTGNPNLPVENVSWEDVQEFIKRLNEQEGWEVCRLPTDAQWEYAARAGTTMEWYESDVDAIAWYAQTSGGQTHEVGQKRPNAWGLYDMLGNVWEWCYDGKREYTADTVVDPVGLTIAGTDRVIRGGSWINSVQGVRVALRNPVPPGYHNNDIGFRCASSGRRR